MTFPRVPSSRSSPDTAGSGQCGTIALAKSTWRASQKVSDRRCHLADRAAVGAFQHQTAGFGRYLPGPGRNQRHTEQNMLNIEDGVFICFYVFLCVFLGLDQCISEFSSL